MTSLKGKSRQEILTEIRSLKREISRLKRELESPDCEVDFLPAPLTKLHCNREYLERAIKAYEEAGGRYEPTKNELRSLKFDQALDSLQELTFSSGGYFGGFEVRTFAVLENEVRMEASHIPMEDPSKYPYCEMLEKDAFIEALREIHMGEWKRNYVDPGVLDGTQWRLELKYNGNKRPVCFSGSNAYPYNFEELTDLLMQEY